MTREEYMTKLQKYLRKLPKQDYEDAIEYFNEYFTEWNGCYAFQYYPNNLGDGNYGLPMFLLIKKTDGSCRECTAEERDKILRS